MQITVEKKKPWQVCSREKPRPLRRCAVGQWIVSPDYLFSGILTFKYQSAQEFNVDSALNLDLWICRECRITVFYVHMELFHVAQCHCQNCCFDVYIYIFNLNLFINRSILFLLNWLIYEIYFDTAENYSSCVFSFFFFFYFSAL